MSNSSPEAVIRTPDQRLRVFVSSTLQELVEERVGAHEAISGLRLTPVMFEIGARPHPPRDLYRAYLEQSHIFIGIYWQKYGWVAPGESISGLEDEYRLCSGKPKLIYIKAPAPEREPRLKALLEDIKSVASYKYFATAAELGITEKTIKVHRARVMEKMNIESLAELVVIAERLGLTARRATEGARRLPVAANANTTAGAAL